MKGVDLESRRDALHRSKCQIPLSAFQPTHVRAVHAQHLGERVLRQAMLMAVGAQVRTHRLLEIALCHMFEGVTGAT